MGCENTTTMGCNARKTNNLRISYCKHRQNDKSSQTVIRKQFGRYKQMLEDNIKVGVREI
jgi:hypothetical protein